MFNFILSGIYNNNKLTYIDNEKLIDNFITNNIVVIDSKTYFSSSKYVSDNNTVLVLTDYDVINTNDFINYESNATYFLTYSEFISFYTVFKETIYILGAKNFDYFTKHYSELIDKIYINEVKKTSGVQFSTDINWINLDNFDFMYKLVYVSEKQTINNLDYRTLMYKNVKTDVLSEEYGYLNLMSTILNQKNERDDRTKTGTKSIFGSQLRFDISNGTLPLMTSKSVPFKAITEELLWFIRGDTDAKILQDKKVKIWDGNTSRQFLDNRGLNHYPIGVLGPAYGWQWRFFNAPYSCDYANTKNINNNLSNLGGVDQLEYVVNLLKTDPFSRRIMMSYWNPSQIDQMVLPPCHYSCLFYVKEKDGKKHLSCQFTMRSSDVFLGLPFNIASYSLLTYIIAKKCDMVPDEIIYSGGDCHIYKNHIEQAKQQILNIPRSFPKVFLDDSIKNKNWNEITINDFELWGYFPHPSIKAPMAI